MGTLAAPQQAQETTQDRAMADPSQSRAGAPRQASVGAGYFGNQAMLRRLSRPSPRIQRKLEIGAVNDPLEAEADRVADHVMRMPEPASHPAHGSQIVQRKCAACEEEDKKLQKRSDGECAASGQAPLIVHEVLNTPGEPLDASTRAFMEPRFGYDFSGVRVHTDAQAAESARAVDASAYTVGRDVVFASGQYVPHSAAGQRLFAHELSHVVQQSGGLDPGDKKVWRQDAGKTPAPAPGVAAPSPPPPSGDLGQQTAETGQLTQSQAPEPHGVDRMVFSCRDMKLRIESGGEARDYRLETCSLPVGSYTADVEIDGDDFYLTFPKQVSTEQRFDFSYVVDPGQPNPVTQLKGQPTVHVDVVDHPLLSPPQQQQQTQHPRCIVSLKDRQLVAPDSTSRDLFKPLKFDRTVWTHDLPLGEFGWVEVDLKASGGLKGTLSGQYGPGMLTDICLTHEIGETPSSAPINHPLLGSGSHADVNTFKIGGRARFTLPASANVSIVGNGKIVLAGNYLSVFEVAAIEGGLNARGDASLSGKLDAAVEVIAIFTKASTTLEAPVIPIGVTLSKSSLDKIDLAAEVALKGRASLGFALTATAAAKLLGYEIWRERWNLRNETGLDLGWAGGFKYSPNPGAHWIMGAIGKMEMIDALMRDEDADVETDDVLDTLLNQSGGTVTVPDGLSPEKALPFDWHKPKENYIYPSTLDIPRADDPKSLNRDDGPTTVRFTRRGKSEYDRIGVASRNWPRERKIFQYVPPGGREESEKDRLRRLLTRLGYDRSGQDVDHVHELQFGGDDAFDNLWPADNSANRSAGARHEQQIDNYRQQLGNLAGRYFIIARVQI